MYTILTKNGGASSDNIFTNAVLRPNTGAYIGEEREDFLSVGTIVNGVKLRYKNVNCFY